MPVPLESTYQSAWASCPQAMRSVVEHGLPAWRKSKNEIERFKTEIAFGRRLDAKNTDMIRRLPLVYTPQTEGGFTVTSPVLPKLVTEGDTLKEVCANVDDGLMAVFELYVDDGRALCAGMAR